MSTEQSKRDQVAKVQCQRELCGREFEAILPDAELVNSAKTSILVMLHPSPAICPYCGQAHVFHLTLIKDYMYMFKPIKTDGQPNLIQMPGKTM